MSEIRYVELVFRKGIGYSSVSMRRETETEDGQMWISRATGRALRKEVDVDYGGAMGKGHLSARYEYSNVKPPM